MSDTAVDSVGGMGETRSGKRRGKETKERPERNRKEKNPQIEKREIYRSSERGLEKREGEKRQKSPAAVYQESYQKTQRGSFHASPPLGACRLCSGKTKR